MQPIAIVTFFVAALYMFGRGPLLVAPAATSAFYRRLFSSGSGRARAFGCLFVLLALALILTARQARAAQGDITLLIQGLGWLSAAAGLWVLAFVSARRGGHPL